MEILFYMSSCVYAVIGFGMPQHFVDRYLSRYSVDEQESLLDEYGINFQECGYGSNPKCYYLVKESITEAVGKQAQIIDPLMITKDYLPVFEKFLQRLSAEKSLLHEACWWLVPFYG